MAADARIVTKGCNFDNALEWCGGQDGHRTAKYVRCVDGQLAQTMWTRFQLLHHTMDSPSPFNLMDFQLLVEEMR